MNSAPGTAKSDRIFCAGNFGAVEQGARLAFHLSHKQAFITSRWGTSVRPPGELAGKHEVEAAAVLEEGVGRFSTVLQEVLFAGAPGGEEMRIGQRHSRAD